MTIVADGLELLVQDAVIEAVRQLDRPGLDVEADAAARRELAEIDQRRVETAEMWAGGEVTRIE